MATTWEPWITREAGGFAVARPERIERLILDGLPWTWRGVGGYFSPE